MSCERCLKPQRPNWTELNWPAPRWLSYTTRCWYDNFVTAASHEVDSLQLSSVRLLWTRLKLTPCLHRGARLRQRYRRRPCRARASWRVIGSRQPLRGAANPWRACGAWVVDGGGRRVEMPSLSATLTAVTAVNSTLSTDWQPHRLDRCLLSDPPIHVRDSFSCNADAATKHCPMSTRIAYYDQLVVLMRSVCLLTLHA